MGVFRIWLVLFWYAVFVGVLAAQEHRDGLSGPVAGSSLQPGTTADVGFFRQLFKAVWGRASNATKTTAASSPVLRSHAVAGVPGPARFIQDAQAKAAAHANFSLRVLNEAFSVAEGPDVYIEGSAIYLEAQVQASSGILPTIFVDKCFGTDAKHWSHPKRSYVFVDNHGCFYAGEPETVVTTWFRKGDSVIVLTIPAFSLTGEPEEEIYIHCLLTAWSPKTPTSPGRKACSFDVDSSRWENMDEPAKNFICNCCDSYCPLALSSLRNEGRCQTMKMLLLVSVAFVGSSVVALIITGALLTLVVAFFRRSRMHKGPKPRKNHSKQPYHAELQTVVGSRAVAEETEESNLDYCRLKDDTPEKSQA